MLQNLHLLLSCRAAGDAVAGCFPFGCGAIFF